ncbi:NUDIX hydrolase [Streptomyces sp. NBC_01013]|uniref:NUDIX hydrolase n=1 Tax=Streptomyces sp. NBC_01013 TaxID=2903718 RepID=UPI003867F7E9|nr:NUDIX domain-containing protein [Streptomyces sp. NBC_01013]
MNSAPEAGSVEVSALVTDTGGRLLLTASSAGALMLPTGRTGADTSPRAAAARAVHRTTGLTPRLGALLVCDWRPDGSVRHVLDAGTVSPRTVDRLRGDGQNEFVAPEDLSSALSPADTRCALAALRARRDGRAAQTEHGHIPPVLEVMDRFGIAPALHSGGAWAWHEAPVPAGLPVRQAWVWLFVPDGRVVAYVDSKGTVGLPGGTPEIEERGDPARAAVREVREETNIEITQPVHLGYLMDRRPDGQAVARVRLAAVATAVGPVTTDPATGTVHRRLLVPAHLVPDLCGWGAAADPQAHAAVRAVSRLGVRPESAPEAVEELPVAGLPAARPPS